MSIQISQLLMRTSKPIPYGRQHISEEDIQVVVQALKDDFLTQGPRIAAFENAFSDYIGCKYSVALANGTAALHLAAMGLGVNEESIVLTTPITFAASANCVKYCGGNIELVDADPRTGLMSIPALKAKLESKPKGTYQGVIPVDLAGYPVNLEEVRKLADEYGLWILEDSCHAPGGYFIDSKGVKQNCGNGNYADASIFSFHPVKHIAAGEGGMITTNNKELYEKLLILRTHGITKNPDLLEENPGAWYYEMQMLGYNYRLTDFQAALGLSQLKRAGENLNRRRAIAKRYDKELKALDVVVPEEGYGHAYHLYVIKSKDRKGLYDYLRAKNIFVQVHYIPIHYLPYYKDQGFKKGEFPQAESYYDKCLSLPMYPTLTDEEQGYVIEEVLKFEKALV